MTGRRDICLAPSFGIEGGVIVEEKVFQRWLEKGNTVVSNVLLEYYSVLGMSELELVFVLQLQSCLDQNITFPEMTELARRMGKGEAELFPVLHSLIQKKFVSIRTEKDTNGKVADSYSLVPLYQLLQAALLKDKEAPKETEDVNLLPIFEQEFGRPLSPIEMQTIGEWLDTDHYPKELILEALREAVLNQAYSLKYMDRILLSWEKKNIKSAHQVRTESQKRADYRRPEAETEVTPVERERVPLFNWLEGEDDGKEG